MSVVGFTERLRVAVRERQSQTFRDGAKWSYREIGERVAKEEGRDKPYGATAVSEWLRGSAEPSLATIEAIASVLDVPLRWLLLGEVEGLQLADVTQQAAGADRGGKGRPRGK